ncbi:Asp23/Gls24 family envelope stress response protein [Streptomyces meridianus]|uniref:Asp23/Gls24 family envelope stress response protein n=1 Tax=Streptomyces meridianus TaxID=2938945 RepID=A0ABT0X516_9ACTN|nr:Asp23/Gls24 family envelope stress response protein [Streptomyces meridianus]MCM2577514.1 Asp23/Gls24 family envelope stress response protein [Streptomyces meridianus]
MARSEAAPAGAVAPGGRGATRIADRVVAKIASQAAREALKPLQPPWLAEDPAPPHATVTVRRGREDSRTSGGDGAGRARPEPRQEARVRVSVELAYPSDIGSQCHAVRRHVVQRVGALADMDVPEVAVTVERLHSVHSQRAGGERAR